MCYRTIEIYGTEQSEFVSFYVDFGDESDDFLPCYGTEASVTVQEVRRHGTETKFMATLVICNQFCLAIY
jgi:hypothetical protein